MGFRAAQYAFKKQRLGPARAIFLQIAWSCIDETAFLPWSRNRLADECDVNLRTIERRLPELVKLGLVAESETGFRLPEFYEIHRQNGGQNTGQSDRHIVGQSVGQSVGAYKEGNQGIVFETPPCPLASEGAQNQIGENPEPEQKREQEQNRDRGQKRDRGTAPFDRELPTHPAQHHCTRCLTPHWYVCEDPGCTAYREEYACALALKPARSPP